MTSFFKAQKQKGTALIVVLLLVATLSFIVLAIVDKTVNTVQRTGASMARTQIHWREAGTEQLSKAVIFRAMSVAGGDVFTEAHPLFTAPYPIPFPQGSGVLALADATRCFNINSLVSANADDGLGRNEAGVDEFKRMAIKLGLGEGEIDEISDVVIDWIDSNSSQELRGAEDGFYTNLPVPFRSGGSLLASVTELRAMKGMSNEIYETLAPFLCAYLTPAPNVINVNFLRPQDAPLLAAALREEIDLVTINEFIAQRPPGGYQSKEEVIALPAFAPLRPREDENNNQNGDEEDKSELLERLDVKSSHVEVAVQLEFNGINIERRLLYSLPLGREPSLQRRTRGGPDR